MPVTATSFERRADRRRSRRAERRDLAPRTGRGRLPPAGRARLAAAGAADLPEHRCPTANRRAAREFLGAIVADRRSPGGEAAKIGPPSIDIDEHRETAAALRRRRRRRAWSKATTDGRLDAGRCRWARRSAGPEPPAASVMNPEGGGVSAWPSNEPDGAPGGRRARGLPRRRRADGAAQRRRRRPDRRTGGRALRARRRARRLPAGPARRRGDRGGAGQRAAGSRSPSRSPKGWIKPAQLHVVMGAGRKRRRAADLPGRARRAAPWAHRRRVLATPSRATRSQPVRTTSSCSRRDISAGGSEPRNGRESGRHVAVRPAHEKRRTLVVQVSDTGSGLVPRRSASPSAMAPHRTGTRSAAHRYARTGTFTVFVSRATAPATACRCAGRRAGCEHRAPASPCSARSPSAR